MNETPITRSAIWLWRFCLLAVALALASACQYDSREGELRQAFERYLTVLNDAYVTLDTSRLPEVAASPRLEATVSDVQAHKSFPEIASEEFEVASLKVLSYTDTVATVEAKWNYRPYTQSFSGGERIYAPTDRWYWRLVKVTLVKDDGTWKVKEISIVDWSG